MDLHVHTVYSGTGSITLEKLLEEAGKRNLSHLTITDSGDVEGVAELLKISQIKVLPGLELSSEEGHFLIFCEDMKFLRSFGGYIRSISKMPQREDLAVVWAHPWAYTPDGSRRAPFKDEHVTQEVLQYVHALEVFNGNMAQLLRVEMLSKNYIRDVIELARVSGKGMIGGSDSHGLDRFFLCWTELQLNSELPEGEPEDFSDIQRIIKAIREGRTKPRTSIPEYQYYLPLICL